MNLKVIEGSPWRKMDDAPLGETLECALPDERFVLCTGVEQNGHTIWRMPGGETVKPIAWMRPGDKERFWGASDPGVIALNEELERW
jgi:hypothetical protein